MSNQFTPAPRTPYEGRLLRLSKSIGEIPEEQKPDFSFYDPPESGEDHEAHLTVHERQRGLLAVKALKGNAQAASDLSALEKHIGATEKLIKAEGYNSRGRRRLRSRYFDPREDQNDSLSAQRVDVNKARLRGAKRPKMPAKMKDVSPRFRPYPFGGAQRRRGMKKAE